MVAGSHSRSWCSLFGTACGETESVTLRWSAKHLTSLVIEDEAGNVLHTAAQTQLDSGSFSLGALPMGDHLFRVKGVGQIPRDQHEVEIELAVYDPYSLDSFTASTNFVNEPPASVTLSWSATNLTSAQIVTDHGDVIAIDPAELAGGSIEVTPLVTTTYTFEAESFGRHLQSSVTVEVRSVKFDSVDASSSRVTFGASVSLNWGASATTPNAAVWIDGPNAPVVDFVEVFDSPFEDISVTGGARLSSDLEGDAYAYVAFPSGFAFPFSGALHTSARAAGTGMITFSPAHSRWEWQHTALPNPSKPEVHLAVFWGDLDGQPDEPTAGIYGKFVPGPEPHYIIQWKNWRPWENDDPGNDLNFQVVLYESGVVEYRYGTMLSSDGTAEGGNVAIGLQRPGGYVGTLLHRSTSSAVAFPGGLANRSFRWDPRALPLSGNVDLAIVGSGPLEVCVSDGYWTECHEVPLEILPSGAVTISEVMLDPIGGAAHQWFELINLHSEPVDLQGLEIRMGYQSQVIGEPLVLAPMQAVVFARSDQPGFTPDYVYDSSLVMTVPEGDVGIYLDGVAVSKVSWSSSWTIPQGASLELLLREIAPGIATWTSESVYKVSQKPYDGMNKGTPGTGFVEDSEHYFVQASLDVPFIDIRSTGTRVTALETDTANSAIPVSFSIPFFDDVVTEVYASTNGWIRFGSSSASGHFAPGSLPRSTSASPVAPLFAVYWDDWGCSQSPNPMQFHYEEKVIDGASVLVLQWTNYRRCGETGGVTFQAHIWENGDLATVIGEIWTDGTSSANRIYAGEEAWIGLEPAGDPAGHVTAQFRKPVVFPGLSVVFQKK